MAPSNKYLTLLDQGLNDFVFERDENEEPVLGDNPLMLAPWRDELLDLLESRNPALKSVLLRGLLLDNGGGVVFSTLEQATDYYNGVLPVHTVNDPASLRYVRSTSIAARYAADTNHVELARADLEKRHSVSPSHIELASSQILSIVCKTVKTQEPPSA